jgi:hypothetical protein
MRAPFIGSLERFPTVGLIRTLWAPTDIPHAQLQALGTILVPIVTGRRLFDIHEQELAVTPW